MYKNNRTNYSVEKSLVSRMEKASNEPELISIYTVAELLKIKPSELLKCVEERLPKGFSVLED